MNSVEKIIPRILNRTMLFMPEFAVDRLNYNCDTSVTLFSCYLLNCPGMSGLTSTPPRGRWELANRTLG